MRVTRTKIIRIGNSQGIRIPPAGQGDDALLYDASLTNTWDEQEWVW